MPGQDPELKRGWKFFREEGILHLLSHEFEQSMFSFLKCLHMREKQEEEEVKHLEDPMLYLRLLKYRLRVCVLSFFFFFLFFSLLFLHDYWIVCWILLSF